MADVDGMEDVIVRPADQVRQDERRHLHDSSAGRVPAQPANHDGGKRSVAHAV